LPPAPIPGTLRFTVAGHIQHVNAMVSEPFWPPLMNFFDKMRHHDFHFCRLIAGAKLNL
jgi:hypothetical protein